MKTCHNCKFCEVETWVTKDRETGKEKFSRFTHECRFNAPVLNEYNEIKKVSVKGDYWCGQWTGKKGAKL